MGRKERMRYILAESNTLDLAVLRKVKMCMHHLGLKNTVAYLYREKEENSDKKRKTKKSGKKSEDKKTEDKKSGVKTERSQVYGFIDNYVKFTGYNNSGLLPILSAKESVNNLYTQVEMEIKKLIVDTILMKEAGIMECANSEETVKKERILPEALFYIKGRKGDGKTQRNNIDACAAHKSKTEKEKEINAVINLHYRQQEKMIEEFKTKNYCEIRVEVQSRDGSRLAVGLGEPSVREIGLRTNFLTGLPELPSTAIKGVFRHFCEEQENLDQEILDAWFGTEEEEGCLIFLDGILGKINEPFQMKEDVITIHYDEYYKDDNKYPVQRPPVINNFISVKINQMTLIILIKPEGQNAVDPDKKNRVEELFLKCIEECSFGAKGALGYGYLNVRGQEGKTDAGMEKRI